MKKLLFMAVAAFTMLTFATSCKKKVSDADVQTAVMAELGKMTELKGGAVTVKDGVATVTGECMDQACSDRCKKALEDLKLAGVKSVEWKCSLTPPPVSMVTTLTADVQKKVTDGLKDIKGVVVSFAKGVVLNGAVSAADNMKIKQILASAKVMMDPTSKLTVK